MLTELRIKNFAIIESLTLPLAPGLNVLSGETGAGKSIIVGALGLLLGERANADLIRTGADRATVEGSFDCRDRPEVPALLDERGIEVEESVVMLKREIASGGRARAWVNGTAVNATMLGEIARHLVNLHGQHEAQALLDADSQRRILDAFAGADESANAVRAAYDDVHAVRREIADLARRRAEAGKRADYLRHVAREIEDSKLSPGEDERLEDEARRLEHAEELRSLANGIVAALDGEEASVLPQLAGILRSLTALQRIDPALQRLRESYDAGYYALDALARELERYERTVELDPARLEVVRQRRDLLYGLTKKYGATIADVIEAGREARSELDILDSAELDLRSLHAREAAAMGRLTASAAALSDLRRSASIRLAAAVDEMLPELGMPGGRFEVARTTLPEIGPHGAEDIGFRVSLNVGHDPRPLERVASGGELSRVMLALKTILARLDRVPTLVFDEVDAGIGGRVGLQVGETMRRVAAFHQVFAISHLPQIAARAHHHIVVSKGARGGVTTADIAVVTDDERVVEIARMLGGDPESTVSLAHARELLHHAMPAAPAAGSPPAPSPMTPARTRQRRAGK